MHDEAVSRMADAELLRTSANAQSDAAYLLDLLAFEILLKAALIIDQSKTARNHGYKELFALLSPETQSALLVSAAERMGPHADYSRLDSLLDLWALNFVQLRYPYEKYDGMTREQFVLAAAEWIERGALVEEATFAYYPQELTDLLYSLSQYVSAWLANPTLQGTPADKSAAPLN
jgi:HEPN domain-containing protein